jgi:Xaa-Pro aminopeptidase
MNSPHELGVLAASKAALEAVDPKFIKDGLRKARDKTKEVYELILKNLKEGMSEDDARRMTLQICTDLGVKKHWHRPYIRFGVGTTLTFNDPVQPTYPLAKGDACYIDLGPVWPDEELGLEYEGDYGDSFVFGENPEAQKCGDACRMLFQEARDAWAKDKLSGQAVYELLKRRSEELGYELLDEVAGHRVGDFPHHRFSKSSLAELAFIPSDTLWILEVQIIDKQKRFGAFYEDIL